MDTFQTTALTLARLADPRPGYAIPLCELNIQPSLEIHSCPGLGRALIAEQSGLRVSLQGARVNGTLLFHLSPRFLSPESAYPGVLGRTQA